MPDIDITDAARVGSTVDVQSLIDSAFAPAQPVAGSGPPLLRDRPPDRGHAPDRPPGSALHPPRRYTTAVVALALVSLGASLWHAGATPQDPYYEAAVRSMASNWHAFLFGAFDPAGTVTIDKLPGAFWPQALLVRALGYHVWLMVLPQAIEGALTVALLARGVRRLAGWRAGAAAAAVLASAPAFVLLERGTMPDSLMTLLLVAAADQVARAVAAARPGEATGAAPGAPAGRWWRWTPSEDGASPTNGTPTSERRPRDMRAILLAALLLGLAFEAKMAEAWLAAPALALAFLLAGSGSARRRAGLVACGMLVAAVASLAWPAAVSLVPAHNRPYIDGSTTDSPWQQVFLYNGTTRFSSRSATVLEGAATNTQPPAGPARLLGGTAGRATGWLLPLAAAVAAVGLWRLRRRHRRDPMRAALALWGTWALVYAAAFSAGTSLLPYYPGALDPAVAALCGIAAAVTWERRHDPTTRALAALACAGTIAYGAWLVPARGAGLPEPVSVALRAAAAASCAAGAASWLRPGRRSATLTGAVLVSAGAFALPAAASASAVQQHLGPFDTPFEPARSAALIRVLPRLPALLQPAIRTLDKVRGSSGILLATDSSVLAAPFIAATGDEVLPIGGATGTGPVPTMAQLRRMVAEGQVHVVVSGPTRDPRIAWVRAHCTAVPFSLATTGSGTANNLLGGVTVDLCTPASATGVAAGAIDRRTPGA